MSKRDSRRAQAFARLVGVRLGAIERALLLHGSCWLAANDLPWASADEAELRERQRRERLARRSSLNRAAARLRRLGLFGNDYERDWETYNALTPLGRSVVERYRHDLETHQRIRWVGRRKPFIQTRRTRSPRGSPGSGKVRKAP